MKTKATALGVLLLGATVLLAQQYHLYRSALDSAASGWNNDHQQDYLRSFAPPPQEQKAAVQQQKGTQSQQHNIATIDIDTDADADTTKTTPSERDTEKDGRDDTARTTDPPAVLVDNNNNNISGQTIKQDDVAPPPPPPPPPEKMTTTNMTSSATTTTTTTTVAASPPPPSLLLLSKQTTDEKTKNDDKNENVCMRCPHYENVIIADKYCCAGLLDRMWLIPRLVEIGAYFCARLYVPHPWEMLSEKHNKGVPISKNLAWSDFMNLTLTDLRKTGGGEGEFAWREYNDTWTPIEGEIFNLNKVFQNDAQKKNWFRLNNKNYWEVPENERNEKFGQETRYNLALLENITQQQLLTYYKEHGGGGGGGGTSKIKKGFIWQAYAPVYYWDEFVNEHFERQQYNNATNCRLPNTKTKNNNIIQKHDALGNVLADEIFKSLAIQHPTTTQFGLMHIRRTDVTTQCDTSIEKVAEYLSCGVEGAEAFGNTTVLLASDETEPCYRGALVSILNQLGFSVVDLDATVWAHLRGHSLVQDPVGRDKYLNNMFEFRIVADMYWEPRMKFHLIRRKSQCDDCAYFRDRLSWTGKEVAAKGVDGGVVPGSRFVDVAGVNQTYYQCLADGGKPS